MTEAKIIARKRITKHPAVITDEQRRQMISEAAYYLSEQRGFAGGDPIEDWLEAETKVDQLYGKAA